MIKLIDFENDKIVRKDGKEMPLSSYKLFLNLGDCEVVFRRWPRYKKMRYNIHDDVVSGKPFPKLEDKYLE